MEGEVRRTVERTERREVESWVSRWFASWSCEVWEGRKDRTESEMKNEEGRAKKEEEGKGKFRETHPPL